MANESSSSSPFNLQMLVLVAAGLGVVLFRSDLHPFLHSEPDSRAKDAEVCQLDSHLWEDPYRFMTQTADRKTGDSGRTMLTECSELKIPTLEGRSGDSSVIKICILPVVVRGDFRSAESRETRIRIRFAVASGLGAYGLRPEDPLHLLVTTFNAVSGESTSGVKLESTSAKLTPMEWFTPSSLPRDQKSSFDAVLVVWVKAQSLIPDPLGVLRSLATNIRTRLKPDGAKVLEFKTKVIGPYWSGTLVDMLSKQDHPAAGATAPDPADSITFYSATSTMADGMLEVLSGNDGSMAGAVPLSRDFMGRDRLRDGSANLVNLTCTDEDMAGCLWKELELRGVDFNDPSTRVAIISSWDTDYGRVLPLTYAAKLRQMLPDPLKPPPPGKPLPKLSSPTQRILPSEYSDLKFDHLDKWPPQILRAYYLSGVDGNLGNSRSLAGKSSSASPASESPISISVGNAEGEHQVDYAARLGQVFAERIQERDADVKDMKSPAKLRAIGVLGQDVYDKLILIQALRESFPDAIFFTDTLDARYLNPAVLGYTRNLVVASPFGLELNRNLQLGATPFRSSEQAAIFLATQVALSPDGGSLDHLQHQLHPLLFEIGRTYAVPLVMPDFQGSTPTEVGSDDTPPSSDGSIHRLQGKLHPSVGVLRTWTDAEQRAFKDASLWTALALFGGGATLLFVFQGKFRLDRGKGIYVVIGSLTVILIMLFCVFYIVFDGVEPLSWFEGLSLWPSELLRLISIAITVGGLFYCQLRVRASREELSKHYGLPAKHFSEHTLRDYLGSLREVFWHHSQREKAYLVTKKEAAGIKEAVGNEADYHTIHGTLDLIRQKTPPSPSGSASPLGVSPESARYVSSEFLWRYYNDQATNFRRHCRAVLLTLLYLSGCVGIFKLTGRPSVPYRGEFSYVCDQVIVGTAFILLVYLIFWIVDETHNCLRLVKKLDHAEPTLWPNRAYHHVKIGLSFRRALEEAGMGELASPYVDVCFIGRLTQQIVPLIQIPFAALTLLIVARWNFFANWHATHLLMLIFGLQLGICVMCAIFLTTAAMAAKRRASRSVELYAANARAAGEAELAEALDKLQAAIDDNEEGAFRPWHQQPFVHALLLPFGGGGSLYLIEYLLKT
jgi:hypothetical protein